MKIIKRNGSEVPFDITKIITAVTKASDSVGGKSRLTREQINQIADDVTEQCQALNRAVSVEEVQDMVENQLMDIKAHDVARHYITYRYVQSLKRQTNTTDERILSLIECQNEEVKQENANKNPTVNSVQRDYMAGEISKDLTARLLLDPEIVKAHQEGLIHFHDSDYFAQHMHNCDLVNLEDMLQNGTVISAVPLCQGIARLGSLKAVEVEGATGELDTNYEGKTQAALDCLADGDDFVAIHVEAPDECGHRAELENKVYSIGAISEKILRPVVEYLDSCGEEYSVMLLPDHPTPICRRTHTLDPVPFMIYRSGKKEDGVSCFCEKEAEAKKYYIPHGYTLMSLFTGKNP